MAIVGQHQSPLPLIHVGTLGALINASCSVPGVHKAAKDRQTSIDML